jgi:argininosuccinate lyase
MSDSRAASAPPINVQYNKPSGGSEFNRSLPSFAQAPIHEAFAFDLQQQLPLFNGVSLADIAHVLAITEGGIIPAAEGAALLAALIALHARPADFVPEPACGDLYANREAWLAAQTPAAGHLGAGRARREAVTTGYHLVARQKLLELAASLCEVLNALLERAAEYSDAIMPDYTYLRPAQPSTFGHYILSFAYPTLRDLDRVRALFGRLNLAPVGCGGASGSRLPVDRKRVAQMLGFDGCVVHTRDAVWQADTAIEAASVAAAAAINLSRLAEDLQVFNTEEFNLIGIAEAHTRASILMPQKKNAFALAYMRAVANEMIALQTTVAAAARTTTGQVDSRMLAYAKVPQGLHQTGCAAVLMADVVRSLRFNRERGNMLAEKGFVTASDLAEQIMDGGKITYRTAYEIVKRVVTKLAASGLALSDATHRDLEEAARAVLGEGAEIALEDFSHVVDLRRAVAARSGLGGAAPGSVEAMLDECRGRLADHAGWCERAMNAVKSSEEALLKRAREHLRSD